MTAPELFELVRALCLPDEIRTEGRHKFAAIEALCLTCARLRSAGVLYELVSRFDRSAAAVSEIVTWVLIFVNGRWGHLLDFDHEHLLSPPNLEKYEHAVHESGPGAPLTGVWGFIDCTIRRICRPSHWQRQAYNDHKKHCGVRLICELSPDGAASSGV
ncbi:hypothetical protein K503DRAFT_174971 [Rhizopogon vinicolor AM-OR11-026]|uniref:DDE Tnp4 domain-containing protein n=1 Tax=Rhizopogon vinicolor AM-OR11-026 TaxID=1314800 RepID=A0A1B7MDU0_9AGAM|nr:hypothetical protein K503DRAFT_174971 [Rhizopogon vinicolor AM-OR11-026]